MGVIVFWFALCGTGEALSRFPTSSQMVPSKCELAKSQEYGYVIMRRKELLSSAFAAAFSIFIEDLEKLEREGDELTDSIAAFERNDCDSHNQDVSAYERESESYRNSCSSQPLPAICSSIHAKLAAWEQRSRQRYNRLLPIAESYIARMNTFDQRAAKARQNAEIVLDFDNTEQVFRLYVWTLRRSRQTTGSPTSCESFGRLLDALGKQVKNEGLFVDYLSRTLVEERLDLNFFTGDPRFRPLAGSTFDASGFRRQYYQRLSENQVRHIIGFIVAGYVRLKTPAMVASFFLDSVWEGSEEDFELAIVGANLGVGLRIGTYSTDNFGRAVRGRVCN